MGVFLERVYRHIDEHLEETIGDLVRLCRQPSVSAQKLGMAETAQLVSEMLRQCGLSVQLLPLPSGDYPVIYAELAGDSPKTLLFYNHYDVQPPEPLELWSSPPFEPTAREGKLYARGVSDNKGDIVARLAAIKAYRAVHGRLPVTVKFCIEGEEEIGSPHLSAFVQERAQLLKADACIWEGGGVNWQDQPLLTLGLKGILYVELEAKGANRDLHSSMATVVPNPAWRLLWALNTLKDREERILIEGFYDDVRPPSQADLEAIAHMPEDDEATRRSLGLEALLKGVRGNEFKRRHLFEPTCTICGLISGYTGEGAKTVLPSWARAKLDFRLVPDQQPEDILAKLRRHLDKAGFADISIAAAMEGEEPARTPLDAPFVRVVYEAAQEVYELEPVIVPTMAASGPMAAFTHTLGLPTVACGVNHPDCRMHAPDENIRIQDLIKGIRHIAAILRRFAAA